MATNWSAGGVLILLSLIVLACTFLVAYDKLDSDLFMGVVVGPVVGGLIGFAAGTKGVQQGSQASTAPPAPDA